VWVVFEIAFLLALETDSAFLVGAAYFFRGFGFPLFAFAFLVWINAVVDKRRHGAAVGWFYVMFTGGLPTLGSLVAVFMIPSFGGGFSGQKWTMIASTVIVAIGFCIAWFGVKERHGSIRLAPEGESAGAVISSGLRLTFTNKRIAMGFLTRLINTAPEFGMFIILPTVIAVQLEWGMSRWLVMTTVVYAGNILFNAAFGALGDKVGWVRTVRWFGIVGSAIGLLLWWYVPHIVPAGSDWGFVVSVIAGTVFGILLAGFVPLGAIMPALAPKHTGAAMAMYTTAAGGATFLGSAVVAVVRPWGGNVGVVWAFVLLYGLAFLMTFALKVEQPRVGRKALAADDACAGASGPGRTGPGGASLPPITASPIPEGRQPWLPASPPSSISPAAPRWSPAAPRASAWRWPAASPSTARRSCWPTSTTRPAAPRPRSSPPPPVWPSPTVIWTSPTRRWSRRWSPRSTTRSAASRSC